VWVRVPPAPPNWSLHEHRALRRCCPRTCARGLRDAEHGNDAAGPGDLDLGDQGFDERFALAVAASGDDLVDVVGHIAQRGGWRHRRFCVKLAGEFVAAGSELPGLGLELSEAACEVFGLEGAVLERGEVPGNRRVGPGQFLLGGGEFAAPGVDLGSVAGLSLGVGVDPLAAARSGVVSGAPVAGVLRVDLCLAVRAGAEHGAAARWAADQPGEHCG
jgi:hypothetical protein